MKGVAFATPLVHEYVFAPEPIKVTGVPTHTLWLEPALTVGKGLTVTVTCAVFEHPLALVPVTVYVCVAKGVKVVPFTTPLFQE